MDFELKQTKNDLKNSTQRGLKEITLNYKCLRDTSPCLDSE